MSGPDRLAALQAELAANARARIPFLIAGVDDAEYQALEARAVELRSAIRAATPPSIWEDDDS